MSTFNKLVRAGSINRSGLMRFTSRRFKASSAATQPADDNGSDVKPFHEIPTPKGIPFFGTTLEVLKNAAHFNEMVQARHEKYGPIYREKLGFVNAVFLTDVEGVEQLLRKDGKYPERIQIEHWLHYREQRGLKKGLVMSDGETWHSLRRVVDKHMMRIKTVESYAPDLNAVAKDLLDRLARIRTPENEVPKLNQELFNWALESIAVILYEKRLGCLSDVRDKDIVDYIQSSHDIFETTRKMVFFPPNIGKMLMPGTYKKHDAAWDVAFRISHEIINKRIKEIRETTKEGEHVGFITHFLMDDAMTIEDAYANISELMGAAIDTTSNTTLMILYEIARNPEVQKAIYDEITGLVPEGEHPGPEHVRQMHYMKAVIKEGLRMYPTASAVHRKVQQDMTLFGYHIPKGTTVWVDQYTMGRLKRHYDDPETFRPERWLRNEAGERVGAPNPFAWLPFGFGPRMCVGRRVAELEMQLLIPQLVRKFHLKPATPEPVRMMTNLLFIAQDPVRLILRERESL